MGFYNRGRLKAILGADFFNALLFFSGYKITPPLRPTDTLKGAGHRVFGYIITSPSFAA